MAASHPYCDILSKVEITSANLLEVVSFYAHVIAVRCYLGVLWRLGRGCSSGKKGEEHQKLWRKFEKLTAV